MTIDIGTERLRKIAEIFDKGAKRARDTAAKRKNIGDEQLDIEVAAYHVEAAACVRALIAAREYLRDRLAEDTPLDANDLAAIIGDKP